MTKYTKIPDSLEKCRMAHPLTGEYGDEYAGWFNIKLKNTKGNPLYARVCYCAFAGWEHASVSLNRNRTPTWDEMCQIKDMFWRKDQAVIQIHPAESEYVNNHDYCLHLWRSIDKEQPIPPKIFV